jgi:uncharacterized protein YhaN
MDVDRQLNNPAANLIQGARPATALDVAFRPPDYLESECQALFTPGGHKQTINSLLPKLDEAHNKIKALNERADRYRQLQIDIAAQQLRVEEMEQQRAGISTGIHHDELLERAWPEWVSLHRSSEQAKQLGDVTVFPADGLPRVDNLRERLTEAEERRHRLQEDCDLAQQKLAGFSADSKLLHVAADTEFQAEDLGRLESVQEELSKVRRDLEHSETRLAARLQQIGADWDEPRLQLTDLSEPTTEQVREHRNRLNAAAESRREAEGDVERLEGELRRASGAAEEAEADLTANPPVAAKDRRERKSADERRLRKNLIRLKELHVRLEHSQQRADDLRQRSSSSNTSGATASVVLPRWPAALLFFVVGGVAFSVRSSAAGWGIGMLAVALSLGWLWLGHHLASKGSVGVDKLPDQDATHEADEPTNRILGEIERLTAENRDLCSPHGWTIGDVSDLDAIEREVDELREAERLEQQRGDRRKEATCNVRRLEGELADANARLARRRQEREGLGGEWSRWLMSHGHPTELSPDGALEILHQLKQAKGLLGPLEEQRGRCDDLQRQVNDLTDRALSVLVRCDRPAPDPQAFAASLRSLQTEMAQAQQAATDADRRQEALTERFRELAEIDQQTERLKEELAQLFLAGGAEDEEAFRLNAERHRCRQDVAAQMLQARGALEKLSGPGIPCADLEDKLSATTHEHIASSLARRRGELAQLATALSLANQDLGSLKAQRESLETSNERAELQQEQAFLKERLDAAVDEWAIRRITRCALERARQRYEQERQPRVLQDASLFFTRITDGAYRRVISPLGEPHIELERADGTRCKPEVLSRGTREQLYLCLRFGFVREYCQNTESLPVVMDDILVNFDPSRAARTAEAIAELARSHQVLYLTCHPSVAALLQRTDPTARMLFLHNGTIQLAQPRSVDRALSSVG